MSNSANSSPSSSSIKPSPNNFSTGTATSGERTERTERTFVTTRLPFAVFLHASQKLRLLDLEPDANKTDVHFIFADPDGLADDAEYAFENGECISAAALFASQKFLRKKMTAVLGGRRGERKSERP